MTIPLGRALPDASRDQPGRRRGNAACTVARRGRPYSVLLPVGFAVPPPLPGARCALTAPFHPCPRAARSGRAAVCFLWHFPWGRPRRALPGTVFPWSPDFPPPPRLPATAAAVQPSDARECASHAAAASQAARPRRDAYRRRAMPSIRPAGSAAGRRRGPAAAGRSRRVAEGASPWGHRRSRRARRLSATARHRSPPASVTEQSSPGSVLRKGAMSECATTSPARGQVAGEDVQAELADRGDLRGGKGRSPCPG